MLSYFLFELKGEINETPKIYFGLALCLFASLIKHMYRAVCWNHLGQPANFVQ